MAKTKYGIMALIIVGMIISMFCNVSASTKVYYSSSGKCYHLEKSCKTLKNSKIKSTTYTNAKKTRRICKVCNTQHLKKIKPKMSLKRSGAKVKISYSKPQDWITGTEIRIKDCSTRLTAAKFLKKSKSSFIFTGTKNSKYIVYVRYYLKQNGKKYYSKTTHSTVWTKDDYNINKLVNITPNITSERDGRRIKVQWHNAEPWMYGVKIEVKDCSTQLISTQIREWDDYMEFGGSLGTKYNVSVRYYIKADKTYYSKKKSLDIEIPKTI